MNTCRNISNGSSISKQTARQLSRITSEFYTQQAQSFSATRQMPWQGWQHCLDVMSCFTTVEKPRVLDVGCGNLRFARFLTDQAGVQPATYFAVDNCEALVQSGMTDTQITFIKMDLVNSLLDTTLETQLKVPACDLVVAFGFLHHVPGVQNRIRLLCTLLDKTKPGGYLCVSFWQFMNSAKLAAKASKATAQALQQLRISSDALEKDDYLLGWQDQTHTWRYCHHFTQGELEDLVAQLTPQARMCAQFSADGKEGNLNRYIVFQRI